MNKQKQIEIEIEKSFTHILGALKKIREVAQDSREVKIWADVTQSFVQDTQALIAQEKYEQSLIAQEK